jgi:hypothetical protein
MGQPLYGSEKYGNEAEDFSKYLDFCSGYQGNLQATGISISEAEAVASLAAVSSADQGDSNAATMVASAVNTSAITGAAAGTIHLPTATKGTHLCLDYADVVDGSTGAHHIDVNGGALLSTGSTLITGGVLAKQVIGGSLGNGSNAVAIETAGTATGPTSVRLILTPTTGNNFLGAGSVIHFYCPKDGEWLVKVFPVQQGTGAAGAYTVA